MSRPSISHAPSSTTSEPMVMTQLGSGRRGLASAGASPCAFSTTSTIWRLIMQRFPHAIAGIGEVGGAPHNAEIGPRAAERHGHDLLHHAVLHHHDPVGDQYCF